MSLFRYALINVIATLFRMVPWPCTPGLVEIGYPGRQSPVLLTCNYRLTVARIQQALRGVNCYLLIANSRGINAWCSAAGGLFTHHDVISALKTSGIEERVDHRVVILPQLAATGVERTKVHQVAGWRVVWGPVRACDLHSFLEAEGQKTPAMRTVSFTWLRRVEMAIAWAFPISLLFALVLLALWREAVLPAVLLVWGLSLVVFLGFPLYARWLAPQSGRKAAFEQGKLQLVLWVLCLAVLGAYAVLAGRLAWAWLWRWGLLTLVGVLLVTVDLSGMTPTLKSGTHEDRAFRIVLDVDRCTGDGACVEVCPRGCFALDATGAKTTMPGIARCVQCGACIVQCPCDALSFVDPSGKVLSPNTIRRCKLNLMGKRAQLKE
jgi:NAD-dependent dihydropyrimidine dehydrogenase PreA subunit